MKIPNIVGLFKPLRRGDLGRKKLGCARRISRNKNVVKVSFAEKCILMLISVLFKVDRN